MSSPTPTFAQLRALRPGARLVVRLRGGRQITARLNAYPQLVHRGKPGVNRIALEVVDVDAAAKLGDNASIMTALSTRHTIYGDAVVTVTP